MQTDEIKQALKASNYLAQYLAETGRATLDGSSERQISCPNKAAHKNGDKSPSCRYYPAPDEHIFCHACSYSRDLLELIKEDKGLEFMDALKWAASHYGLEYADEPQKKKSQAQLYIEACALNYSQTDYLEKRGISLETAQRFHIGYDPKEQRVVFPQGSGYVARAVDPASPLRYKYPKGEKVTPFNLNALWNKAGDPVYIVEGQIDALSVIEAGGAAVGLGGITHQQTLIDAIKARPVSVPLCVAFDNDKQENTRKQEQRLSKALEQLGVRLFRASLYPDGCKDANDALLKDRSAFAHTLALFSAEALKQQARAENTSTTLYDIPDPKPEEENPAALITGGWLRKGGGAFLVSTSGAGKSVMSIQLAMCWAMGRDFFGIKPVKPLKIGIIEAEDDETELGWFKSNMRRGFSQYHKWTSEDIDKALKRIHLENFVGKTGDEFIYRLKEVQLKKHYDLIIVNPLFSYFGADLSNNKDDSHFFREMLDPVIKDPENGFGVLFIHHANKPPKTNERKGWGSDAFAQYIGAGGTDVAGWARAQLVLTPLGDEFGYFKLVAAKRGGALNWKDAEGKPTREKIIAYAKGGLVFWREPEPDEIPAAIMEAAKKSAVREKPLEECRGQMLEWLRNVPMTKTDFFKRCRSEFKGMDDLNRPSRLAYESIIAQPELYGLGTRKVGRGAIQIYNANQKPLDFTQPTTDPDEEEIEDYDTPF